MADSVRTLSQPQTGRWRWSTNYLYLAVIIVAAAVYFGCIISPPSLMDDVDAVQAQIARNMLTSGDWVTARLDGIIYLEKAPLIYWLIALAYKVFGVHDWVARLPVASSAIALAWLTAAFAGWAFSRRAALCSGLVTATCTGLFLFTRIQIPDVMQTFTVALALWAFLRLTEPDEERPRLWAFLFAASLGVGLLLKSLIGVVFPLGAGFVYLALTHRLFDRALWSRFRPFSSILLLVAIAAPWHILAMLRNPPYFDFTMRSTPGEYHGFFWFFFINEQVLRFLNMRYPRDYNTVPRVWFWLLHFVWLFPWSVYLPATVKLSYRPVDRAGRARLLALCWIGVVLVFFTFSTTQEYYSMPCYPAFALLIGSAMAQNDRWIRNGTKTLAVISGICAAAAFAFWFAVRNTPAPGDISLALSSHPNAYKLSLGHMQDLTVPALAYLRLPLLLAALAFLLGAAGNILYRRRNPFLATALMMIVFFQAARVALVAFDPFLSSRPLADALLHAPPGQLVVDHHYYTYSSIFFYTDRTAWLLNGRIMNLVYGSYAPGAPNIFLTDQQWMKLWQKPERCYLVGSDEAVTRLSGLLGPQKMITVARSGGKALITNLPLAARTLIQSPR